MKATYAGELCIFCQGACSIKNYCSVINHHITVLRNNNLQFFCRENITPVGRMSDFGKNDVRRKWCAMQ